MQRLVSIDGPIDVNSRTVEDLLHGAFRQTLVFTLKQANPLLVRVLERLISGVEQSGPCLRVGDDFEFLIELEACDGVGEQRRRRAASLHQAQHIVIDRTDPGDLRQYLITEGSKGRAQTPRISSTRVDTGTGADPGAGSAGVSGCGSLPGSRGRATFRRFSLRPSAATAPMPTRERIEQAKHRTRHALGALLRRFTVDGLIEAVTGVDQPRQYASIPRLPE